MTTGRRLRSDDPAPDFPGERTGPLLTAAGQPVSLSDLIADGPVVLVFLRGFM
jgi:peroxiredoxin